MLDDSFEEIDYDESQKSRILEQLNEREKKVADLQMDECYASFKQHMTNEEEKEIDL